MHALPVLLAMLLFAPFPASAQVIHACVKNNGTLKIVADPAACGAGEAPLSWNVQGPQGEPGTPGEPGIDGEPGPQGPPGPVLHVFDGLGNDLGLFAGRLGEGIYVTREDTGVTIPIALNGILAITTGLPPSIGVTFAEPLCTGTMLTSARTSVASQVYIATVDASGDPDLLVVPRPAPATPVTFLSRLDGRGGCVDIGPTSPEPAAVPVDPISEAELGITFPVASPLRVAPAPE